MLRAMCVLVVVCVMSASVRSDTVYWDGGGDGTSWHDPLNWSVGMPMGGANSLPTAADSVVLNVAAAPTIRFTAMAGAVTVASLDNREALSIEGGSLTVTGSFVTQGGGSLVYSGGALAGSPQVIGGSLHLLGGGSGVTFRLNSSALLAGTVAPMQTVWINGTTGLGHGDTPVAPGTVNAGTILLESTATNWRSRIVMGAGDLTNLGLIVSRAGTGGERSINGTLVNAGGVVVESGSLVVTGEYDAAGGSIDAACVVSNATITMSAPTAGNALITVVGTGATLAAANMHGYEVWAQGRGGYQDAMLTIGVPSVNNGTIRLQSSNDTWRSRLTSSGGAVTFGAALTLRVHVGSGGPREITNTDVTNFGLIEVASGTSFSMSAGRTLTQSGGLIDAQGTFIVPSGAIVVTGGQTLGDVIAMGSSVAVGAVSAPSVIRLCGASQIVNNLAPNMELWVNGRNTFGAATVSCAPGAVNHGRIRLESLNSTWVSRITMGAGDLSNVGEVVSRTGTGGERSINGVFRNSGRVIVESSALSLTGAYDAAGGTIEGPAFTANCVITMSGDAPLADNVIAAVGTNVTLASEDMRGYEVWVRGRNGEGNARCFIDVPMIDNGVIRLESSNQNWASSLDSTLGHVEFGPDLTLHIHQGTAGPRTLHTSVTNRGRILVNLGISSSLDTGKTLTQAGGLIDAQGSLTVPSGAIVATGGQILGTVVANSSTVDVSAGVTEPSLIQLVAACQIVRNLSPVTELWIRGQNGPGHATASAEVGAVNAGTIRLESSNSNWISRITTGAGDLTNLGVIIARLGTSGERSINGTFTNAGQVIAEGIRVTLTGDYNAAGGSLEGSSETIMTTGTITTSAAAPGAGKVITIVGQSVTILSSNLHGYEIWVNGRNGNGHARGIVGVPLIDNGVIRLESSNDTWTSNLTSIEPKLTFGPAFRLHVNRGSLGTRSILVPVINGGTIMVEAGIVPTVPGPYIQTGTGAFHSRIGGTTSAGRLNVSGAATLAGTIRSDYTGGFVPAGNEMYTVLGATSITGEFSTWDLQPLSPTGPEHVLYLPEGAPTTVRILMCYADCDGSGVLDIFDFLCFGNRFSVQHQYACNCDQSTGPDTCDIFDFLCFGNRFSAGCP